jgi:hypothetical protein
MGMDKKGTGMKLLIEKLVEKEYTSKAGKPYQKYWICSSGDWYSAFKGRHNPGWKEGDLIEVAKITTSTGQDGKVYRNIERPEIEDVYEKLCKVEAVLLGLLKSAGLDAKDTELPEVPAFEDESEAPF